MSWPYAVVMIVLIIVAAGDGVWMAAALRTIARQERQLAALRKDQEAAR